MHSIFSVPVIFAKSCGKYHKTKTKDKQTNKQKQADGDKSSIFTLVSVTQER